MNGFEVVMMNSTNTKVISPCTPSVLARSRGGTEFFAAATQAPNRVRIRTQRSIEPSWFPQTPEIL